MMMAETGLIPKVTGKSSEIAPAGPIPGRTPIKVPIKTPAKQYNKLAGENATLNPNETFSKIPITKSPVQNLNMPIGNWTLSHTEKIR
jgi:hypothetical protein